MIVFLITTTLLFSLFVEFYVGSIALRKNSDNQLVVNLSSMGSFLLHPFHNRFLWNPQLWIVNYPLMITLAGLIYLLLKFDFTTIQSSSLYGIFKRSTETSTRTNLETSE